MTGIRLITLLLALLLVAPVTPALAQDGGEAVIRDCAQDGDLDGDYSQDELDEAYENLPSDIDEYSNCREVIQKARERGGASGANNEAGSSPGAVAGGGGDGDGGGGADEIGGTGNDSDELTTRGERSEDDQVPGGSVADERLSSSGGTLDSDDDSGGMPIPLIVALVLAALAAIAAALYLLRDQLPPGIASRLPGPLKPTSQG